MCAKMIALEMRV